MRGVALHGRGGGGNRSLARSLAPSRNREICGEMGDNYSIWRQHSDAMEIVLSRRIQIMFFSKSCSWFDYCAGVTFKSPAADNSLTSRTSQNITITL
jgi:hypothetical protein